MDNPHDHHPEKDTAAAPPTPTQAELEAVLDADEADVAAGRTVPLEPVLARMREAAELIRQKRAAKEATTHART